MNYSNIELPKHGYPIIEWSFGDYKFNPTCNLHGHKWIDFNVDYYGDGSGYTMFSQCTRCFKKVKDKNEKKK